MAGGVSPAAQAVAAVTLQTKKKRKPAAVIPQQPLLVCTGAFGAFPPAVSEAPCAHAHAPTHAGTSAHTPPDGGGPQEASEPLSLQQGLIFGHPLPGDVAMGLCQWVRVCFCFSQRVLAFV